MHRQRCSCRKNLCEHQAIYKSTGRLRRINNRDQKTIFAIYFIPICFYSAFMHCQVPEAMV